MYIYSYIYIYIYMNVNMYIYIRIYVICKIFIFHISYFIFHISYFIFHISYFVFHFSYCSCCICLFPHSTIGWLRLVGSLNYRSLLQKSPTKETYILQRDL